MEILKRVLIKLTSAKLIITLWAMVMVSYLIFTKTASENSALVMVLASTPIAYCGLNVAQKKINSNNTDKKETNYER